MKLKKIQKPVIYLGFVSLFTDIASEMLYPVTPIFLSALGTSMAVIGIIEGAAELTAGLLKGYFGMLSDKLGRRSIFVVAGYGLSAIAKPLPGVFQNIPTVLFSRIADRIGKGVRTAPRDALLAGYSEGNTGTVFGFHRSMDTLGAAIGPALALLLLAFFPSNYKLVFLLAFIPSVISVIFTLLIKDKPADQPKYQGEKMYWELWKTSPRTYRILVILVTLFSLVNSSDVFLILKSRSITGSDPVAIAGYIFYNFIYAAASYPAGRMADRIGKRSIFAAGLIIFTLVYAGFALLNSIYIIWVLFALYGIYAASTEGIVKAWISDLIPNEKRGTAIGLVTMLSSISVMTGSMLTGLLWDLSGSPALPFLISAAVSLMIAVLLFSLRLK